MFIQLVVLDIGIVCFQRHLQSNYVFMYMMKKLYKIMNGDMLLKTKCTENASMLQQKN